jgi:hypothetical protein
MFREGGLATETSFTRGLVAYIRAFASMDSAMAGQTRGIGECLVAAFVITNVGLFPRVGS